MATASSTATRGFRLGGAVLDDGPFGHVIERTLVTVAWISTWRPVVDPDAWWHLALGERLLDGGPGAFPRTEPFSWLTAGEPFVAHSWGWDLLVALAHRAAGPAGISLLGAAVAATIVALLWRLMVMLAPAAPPAGRGGLVLLGVLASFTTWSPRAGLWDPALLLAAVLVITAVTSGASRWWLTALPLVALAWANLHGSGILALVITLALSILTTAVAMLARRSRPVAAKPLVLAAGMSLLAGTINPFGPAIYRYPFDPSVASVGTPSIAEWRPLDLADPAHLGLLVLLALAGLSLIRGAGRPDPVIVLSAAGWFFAALIAVRFVVLAAPLLAALAASTLPGRPVPPDGSRREGVAPLRPALALSVVALALLLAGWTIIAPDRQVAAIAARQPVDAVEALVSGDCPGRLLPAYDWAGYVAWRTGRAVGAYGSSPRAEVDAQAAVEALDVDPRPWLDRQRVDVVLVGATSDLGRWLVDAAPEWSVRWVDEQAVIAARAAAPCAPSLRAR